MSENGETSCGDIYPDLPPWRDSTPYEKLAHVANIAHRVAVILLVVPGGLYLPFFLYIQITVDFYPQSCFETLQNCEVFNITHVYSLSSCTDQFSYTWSPPGTAIIFTETEFVKRPDESCANGSLVSDPFAQLGSNPCSRLKDLYKFDKVSNYDSKRFFSCATPAPPCHSILPIRRGPGGGVFIVPLFAGITFWLVTLGLCAACCTYRLCQICARCSKKLKGVTISEKEPRLGNLEDSKLSVDI